MKPLETREVQRQLRDVKQKWDELIETLTSARSIIALLIDANKTFGKRADG